MELMMAQVREVIGETALAQIMIAPGLESPAPLPGPPPLEHYLLESPQAAMVVLVLGAVVLWVVGSRRWSRQAVLIGVAAMVLAAGGIWAVAWRVVTPRERVRERTRELVAAVAAAAPERAGPLLADHAVLYMMFTGAAGMDKEGILGLLRTDMAGTYRLHDHRVRDVQVLLEGPKVARAHVLVMVDPEQTRVQTWSWWRIDWVLEDQWRVRAIEPISIQGVDRPGRR